MIGKTRRELIMPIKAYALILEKYQERNYYLQTSHQMVGWNGKSISLWHDNWINQACPLRNYVPLTQKEVDQTLNSIINKDIYNLTNMSIVLPEEVTNKIHSTYIKQTHPKKDTFGWSSRNHNTFSSKAAYELIAGQENYEGTNHDWI